MKKILFISLAVILALSAGLIGCEGEGEDLGDPIELTFLIRTEDERQDIGDYVGNTLEDLGFTVNRQYGISGDLSGLWLGDPALGLWHAYTGGWVSTAVERDSGSNFGQFYTPLWAAMGPLWQAYEPTEEFLAVATELWYNEFSTPAEREALFQVAMPLSMNDSARVFLLDRTSFSPLQTDVALAADAYGGIYGSWLWGLTVHFRDGSGVPQLPTGNTTLRVSTTDVLVDPWNPVAGSNWAYDMFPMRATGDNGFQYDPHTGLQWPHRVADAEVVHVDGLPIVADPAHTADWLTVTTSPDPITVPGTAWADWDAVNGEWDTVSEVHGSNVTCLVKSVVRYPDDIFSVPLHDGSTLDEGDFLFYAIQKFDRAKTDSDIYDPGYVAEYEAFMSHFKGVEFDFSPGGGYGLVVTTYDDEYTLDAELIAGDEERCWFPADQYGPFVWHNLALGYLAEEELELAFSRTKATSESIEWTSLIDGPSLPILADHLANVRNVADEEYRFLPYEEVLDDYITPAEIDARYNNLDAWYTAKGHFYVASGPFYLEDVDSTGKVVELGRFTSYPDDATEWFFTMDPEPTTPPAHTGAWVDVVTIGVDENAAAVSKLGLDQLDVYAFAISDAALKDTCDDDPNIWYYESAGSFNEITLNPVGPFFPETGAPNPFGIPEIRQAMNWAINRDYIVGTIMSGMAIPRYNCISGLSGDGIKYASFLTSIETEYAYDFNKADAAIEAAMLTIPGVSRDTDGTYYYAP